MLGGNISANVNVCRPKPKKIVWAALMRWRLVRATLDWVTSNTEFPTNDNSSGLWTAVERKLQRLSAIELTFSVTVPQQFAAMFLGRSLITLATLPTLPTSAPLSPPPSLSPSPCTPDEWRV